MQVEVIPEVKTHSKVSAFSYSVPKEMESQICVGSIVKVPFGKKEVRGVVAEISNFQFFPTIQKCRDPDRSVRTISNQISNPKYQIKNIVSVDEEFVIPEAYIKIARWVAEYYLCSLGEAIALFLPPKIKKIKSDSKSPHFAQKLRGAQQIAPLRTDATEEQAKRKMLEKIFSKKLSHEQERAFEQLKINLSKKQKKPALIAGVTGSGKTEVYIKLTKEAINQNKQIIVLVPEIVLTPQTVERFREVFGDLISLVHSKLSTKEKFQCYDEFYHGKKLILIGPRSALLVPSKNLGLIIVDEEQEEAYKQEQSPRYNAVDLAEKIAIETGALLVLGSATPKIETYYKAKKGIYDLFEIKSRYHKLLLPPSEIIDLKNEIRSGNFSPISEKLRAEIERVLKSKKQVILFLNRRGTATFVSCRDCGFVVNCLNCDIPMVYHIGNKEGLNCHHCNFRSAVPIKCPSCGGLKIKFFGSGVEKIEKEINKLFPRSRVFLADAKILSGRDKYQQFFNNFKNQKFDIVIGTQILAKGLDIPNVDLVGIISADVGLHMPHFRASEKTFRIIAQVSGRSGRTHNIGKTIIQSYWTESPAIKNASMHDYEKFYAEEIAHRKELNYPPFSKIIRVISENESKLSAERVLDRLSEDLKKQKFTFIGPGACFYSRLRNKWRYHIIIKIDDYDSNIQQKLSKIHQKYPDLVFDVDAYGML